MEDNKRIVIETLCYAITVVLMVIGTFFVIAIVAFGEELPAENSEEVSQVSQEQTQPVVVNDNAGELRLLVDQNKTLGEISGKLDKLNDLEMKIETTNEKLEGVNGKVDGIITQQAQPEPQAAPELLASNNAVTFNAYSNVSPTGTYATYAKQLVPKMGWSDDYVYLADSSSSHVLVWGDLDYKSAGTFTGTGCHYTRWYYSGTGSGYLVQYGDADVTVNTGGYCVLSNLGNYPLLDDGITLLRQEVAFYATVAVLVYSFGTVSRWLLRNRIGR